MGHTSVSRKETLNAALPVKLFIALYVPTQQITLERLLIRETRPETILPEHRIMSWKL